MSLIEVTKLLATEAVAQRREDRYRRWRSPVGLTARRRALMHHGVVERSAKRVALPRMAEPNGMTSRRSSTSGVRAFDPAGWPTISGPFAHQTLARKRNKSSTSVEASLGPSSPSGPREG